jgi:hypothetical protein
MAKRKTSGKLRKKALKKISYDKKVVDPLFLQMAKKRVLPVNKDKKIQFFQYPGEPATYVEPDGQPVKSYTDYLGISEMIAKSGNNEPLPGANGFGYKFRVTTTPKPGEPIEEKKFNLILLESYLRRFGEGVMKILDAGITNDRQHKALKSLVNREFSRRLHYANEYVYGDGVRMLTRDLTNDAEEIQNDN